MIPEVVAAAVFLLGCILFTIDGILYAIECADHGAKGCSAHSTL
jgi:hypothetical protein